MASDSVQPSVFRRVIFSPEDGRLRAGWRLLVHTVLLIITLAVFQGGLTFLILRLGLAGVGDLQATMEGGLVTIMLLVASAIAFTLATWIAWRWLDRKPFLELGLNWTPEAGRDLAFGTLLPAALFAGIYVVEWAAGWLTFHGWAWEMGPSRVIPQLIAWLVIFLIVGYQEELLSRGYHLQTLIDGLNLTWAVVISSSVFAILHIFNPSADLTSTLGIFAAGLFLAYGWIRTGQLWVPIGIHIGWNFFQGPIFGFRVSGLETFHLVSHSVDGPSLLTGGEFGPEAGLLGLAAMALGTAATWWYTRGRSPGLLSEAPAPAPDNY